MNIRDDAAAPDCMKRFMRSDDQIELMALELLVSAAYPEEARALAYDWELLVNVEPTITRLAGEALRDCLYTCRDDAEVDDRMSFFGACVLNVLIDRAREIARHRLDGGEYWAGV